MSGAEYRPARVLLVGGSPLLRHRIIEGLQASGAATVVAEALDCSGAMSALRTIPVDVVVLDMDLAGGGLSCLRWLLGSYLRPVILVTAPTDREGASVLDALAMGAVDFVARPGRDESSVQPFLRELAAKVRAAAGLSPRLLAKMASQGRGLDFPEAGRSPGAAYRTGASAGVPTGGLPVGAPVGGPAGGPPGTPVVSPLPRSAVSEPGRRPIARRVVAIGASTGGPAVLEEILSRLPSDLPASVLITQHMPPGFTAMLARRLDERSALPVYEGFEGAPVEAGLVYVAPGGFHLTVDASYRLHLDTGPAVHFVRPAVDVMLASVAERFGPHVLAVILTGMGSDGTEGARRVKRAGGCCLVQEASSCVVAGMPMSVVRAGLADEAMTPEELARAVAEWARGDEGRP